MNNHADSKPEPEVGLPVAACSLTWCDGCLKRRLCITRKSGVIYEGKDCEIHLCRWCRGHETRRSVNKMNNQLSHDEESVWVFAFRYALGLNTTAPWTVSRFLRKNLDRIRPVILEQMARDICGHYQLHPIPDDWQMLLDAIQTELIKRYK